MGFNKFTWVDRDSDYPSRRTITDEATGTSQLVTIVRNEGTVREQGTQFNATNMNSLENRIDEMFPVSIANGGTGATTKAGIKSELGIMTITTLYENTSGTQSTITLNDSAANYNYIEIYYFKDLNQIISAKIYNPNGKSATLGSVTYYSNTLFLRAAIVDINETTITWRYSDSGWGTVTNNSSSTSNEQVFLISKVIGYK